MLEFTSFADFLASGLEDSVSEVSIGGVTYRQRDSQPLHQEFRYQDTGGAWWSPDYYVVVAAGQSNMVGAGMDGDRSTDPNVMVLDAATGALVPWSYPNIRNNLYIPFANELAESLGRPVLVVPAAVSGSRIDSWLESGSGVNWDAMDASVRAALAAVGQDHVDSFLWLQGESDYPLTTESYAALMTAFIGQVRGADWAGEAMAVLVGELSREGVNAAQNQALQALELAMKDDGLLRFVSSVGLNSADLNGVHFDGASLVDYGHRFFEALKDILAGAPVPEDTAPYLDVKPDAPSSITMYEGDKVHLSADLFFSDAEGDAMWLYGALGKRAPYFLANEDGDLVLQPGFDAAGTHTLYVYASDYQLDSVRHALTVTVLEAPPGASIGTSTFDRVLSTWATAEDAMAMITKSRGLDILRQAAMPDHPLEVTQENLFIRGDAGISGDLTLAPDVLRVTLQGGASFGLFGNDLANYLTGNDGANRIFAGIGDDRAYGGGGDDLLFGEDGADMLYGGDGIDLVFGGLGNDRLFGEDGNDRLEGEDGADLMYGGNGDDLIFGGLGDDRLYGDGGNDRLDGSTGKNQYYGGAGADVFVFSAGETQCILQDFSLAEDRIEVVGRAGIDSLDDLLGAAKIQSFTTSQTWGVRLTIGGDQLLIYHVTLAELSNDQFLFV